VEFFDEMYQGPRRAVLNRWMFLHKSKYWFNGLWPRTVGGPGLGKFRRVTGKIFGHGSLELLKNLPSRHECQSYRAFSIQQIKKARGVHLGLSEISNFKS